MESFIYLIIKKNITSILKRKKNSFIRREPYAWDGYNFADVFLRCFII